MHHRKQFRLLKRAILLSLEIVMTVITTVCVATIAVVLWWLVSTGGTYSIQEGDGIACGIIMFDDSNWHLELLQLFGIPALILLASVRTVYYCHRTLTSFR